jgi:hypothetical protein
MPFISVLLASCQRLENLCSTPTPDGFGGTGSLGEDAGILTADETLI